MSKRVAVFFYGSFMRPDVMAKAEFNPTSVDVAQLNGYDICLDPHANIFPSPMHSIHGIVVQISHAALDRMYGASGVGSFLPEAVLVTTADGRWLPVICYMPPTRSTHLPDQPYLERLIEAAKLRGLPSYYIARLQSYAC
jgi:AIG2-like family